MDYIQRKEAVAFLVGRCGYTRAKALAFVHDLCFCTAPNEERMNILTAVEDDYKLNHPPLIKRLRSFLKDLVTTNIYLDFSW